MIKTRFDKTNLLNFRDFKFSPILTDISIDESTGTITARGNSSASIYMSQITPLPAGTYSLSISDDTRRYMILGTNGNLTATLGYYDSSAVMSYFGTTKGGYIYNTNITFSSDQQIYFGFAPLNLQTYTNCMLVEGTIAKPFIPYYQSIQNAYFNGTKLDHIYYNGTLVYNTPTPSTLLSYPHSIGTLSRMTQTGTMNFDSYNISANPVRFTQSDEDDRQGSAIINFQQVTPSGTLTSAKLYLYGKGSANGFLEVDVGNTYVGDFRLDTTSQERIINLPTGINPNDPIKLTLDEEYGYYVDINAMKLELNYDGGRQIMGVKRTTKIQEPSYHRYERMEVEE